MRYALLTALLSCFLLAGCAGPDTKFPPQIIAAQNEVQAEQFTVLPALPALSDLPIAALRSGSYVAADLQQDGAAYMAGLPNNLVAASEGSAVFSPDALQHGLSGMAYAIYHFPAPDYDRAPELRARWIRQPEGQVFIGVSNWDKERWSWFAGNSEPLLDLGSTAAYLRPADGSLFVAVVCLGSDESQLAHLRLGGYPPQAVLEASSISGAAPLEVILHGSASSDLDGNIVSYEWDMDGDGSFELNTEAEAAAPPQIFNVPGKHTVRLRVTDDSGLSDSAEVEISVVRQWLHSWGGPMEDGLNKLVFDGDQSIYACGFTKSFGTGIGDVLLLKYDIDGVLQWARNWGTTDIEEGVDLAISGDGTINVLAGGGSDSQYAHMLSFNAAGDLLNSMRLEWQAGIFPEALLAGEEQMYILGALLDTEGIERPTLIGYDEEGLLWNREWSLGEQVGTPYRLLDGQITINSFDESEGIRASLQIAGNAGTTSVGAAGTSAAHRLGGPNFTQDAHISALKVGNSYQFQLAGTLVDQVSNKKSAFVAEFDSSPFVTVFSKVWSTESADLMVAGYFRDAGGRNHLCGSSQPTNSAYLFHLDSPGLFLDSAQLSSIDGSYSFDDLCAVDSQSVAACGSCVEAAGGDFSPATVSEIPLQLGWAEALMLELEASALIEGESGGTLGIPEGAVQDDDPDDSDPGNALLGLREIPGP